jgi:hypothetical protein
MNNIPSQKKQIIGRHIGTLESGEIVVEDLNLDIYVLDRFALNRRLFENVCLFDAPKDNKKAGTQYG